MENIINIEHLNKSYGYLKAVNDLSFRVKRGELFAFLGVNGAGKSTTISMICGQLKKDSGNIIVCGENIENSFDIISRRIGVTLSESALMIPQKSVTALIGVSDRPQPKRAGGCESCGMREDCAYRKEGKRCGQS